MKAKKPNDLPIVPPPTAKELKDGHLKPQSFSAGKKGSKNG